MRLFLPAVCVALVVAATMSASDPVPQSVLTREQQTISEAMRSSGIGREPRVRVALAEAFSSESEDVRAQTVQFLASTYPSWDYRPFEDLIAAFGRTYRFPGQIDSILDKSELLRGPREERVALLRRAIVEGSIVLSRGTRYPRELAMAWAAQEGLWELEDDLRQYLDNVAQRYKIGLGMSAFPALFELKRGACDAAEASRLAVARIVEMDDRAFRGRMTSDPGFRSAVFNIADSVCSRDMANDRIADGPECELLQRSTEKRLAAIDAARDSHPRGAGPANDWTATLRSKASSADR